MAKRGSTKFLESVSGAAATTRAMMLVGTANAIQESRTVNGGHGLSTGHANGVAATTQKITAGEQTGAGRINVMA